MSVLVSMDISSDMQSLLAKLDGLELTEGERTAFGQLLGVKAEAEVEGFLEIEQTANFRVQGYRGFIGDKLPGRGGKGILWNDVPA